MDKKEKTTEDYTFEIIKATYSTKKYAESNEALGPGYTSRITGTTGEAYFEVKDENTKSIEVLGNIHGIEAGDLIKVYVAKTSDKEALSELTNKNISRIEKISKEGNVESIFEIDQFLR